VTISGPRLAGPAADPAEVRAAIAHRHAASAPKVEAQVEVRETHISWVFLAGDRAYKLKKPLVLPFLDYGTT
jgi:aminoglycoside phosphotransferase family enzyme